MSTPSTFRAALTPKTSLVAMTHAANVLGTVQPIERIAPIVRAAGALFLVDAAQSAGVVPIDLRSIPIDFLAFPGHKALYGPTGTGALYVGPRAEGRIRPWREGGTGGDSSSETQPTLMPYLLEGGTPNVLGVAGLAAGIGWVTEQGPEALRATRSTCSSRSLTGPSASRGGGSPGGGTPPRTSGLFR